MLQPMGRAACVSIRGGGYLPEHMFSSRAPKLLGAALMDLAEAMLRPVDDASPRELEPRPADDLWLADVPFDFGRPSDHPHRRPARIERRRRQGELQARPAQRCTAPVQPTRPAPKHAAPAH